VLLAQAEEVRREADAELNNVRAKMSIERRKSAMLQQLTITTTDKTMLKPLVESAIENEKKMLSLGIERTRKRLGVRAAIRHVFGRV
jgi:hypothetical protein